MTATIEPYRNSIIVTAETAEQVREATFGLFLNVGSAYADFTMPVQQADGAFVSTGHVRLSDDAIDTATEAYGVP